jgi:hypothetical protein
MWLTPSTPCRPLVGPTAAVGQGPEFALPAKSGPTQRRVAALPLQPGREIACKTSLKTPYCT